MTSFRNNQVKFNTAQLTDTEVLGIMDHTANRWQSAQDELTYLTELAVGRGIFPNVVPLPTPEGPVEAA